MIGRCPLPTGLFVAQANNRSAMWIEADNKVLRVNFFPSRMACRSRFLCFQAMHRSRSFFAKRRRQCGNAFEKVFPLLFPAKLNYFIVLGVQHRSKVFG